MAIALPTTERQTANFMPTKESNVVVPLLQSLITGGFAALVGGSIGGYVAIYTGGGFGQTITGILFYGSGAFVLVAGWQWLSRSNFYDGLLWNIETATQIDIDGDGEIGEPHRVEVEVKHERRPWQFDSLDVDPAHLRHLAELVSSLGDSFSERTASKTGMTQNQFGDLREKFLKHGWAMWNHPTEKRQGIRLTQGGKALLRAILSTPLPPAES